MPEYIGRPRINEQLAQQTLQAKQQALTSLFLPAIQQVQQNAANMYELQKAIKFAEIERDFTARQAKAKMDFESGQNKLKRESEEKQAETAATSRVEAAQKGKEGRVYAADKAFEAAMAKLPGELDKFRSSAMGKEIQRKIGTGEKFTPAEKAQLKVFGIDVEGDPNYMEKVIGALGGAAGYGAIGAGAGLMVPGVGLPVGAGVGAVYGGVKGFMQSGEHETTKGTMFNQPRAGEVRKPAAQKVKITRAQYEALKKRGRSDQLIRTLYDVGE